MRCPKCSARFHVHPDGRVDPAEAVAPVPKPGELDSERRSPKSPAAPPVRGAFSVPKPASIDREARTLDDRPAQKGRDEIDLDLPAPAPPKPAGQRGVKRPLAPPLDLDLPAPKPRQPAGQAAAGPLSGQGLEAPPAELDLELDVPPRAGKALFAELDLDLPAPKAREPELDLDLGTPEPAPLPSEPAADVSALDLPAVKPSAAAGPTKRPAVFAPRKPLAPDFELPKPAARAPLVPDFDLDLPALRGGELEEAGRGRTGGAAGGPSFGDLDLDSDRSAPKRSSVPPLPDLDLDLTAPKPSSAPPPPDLDLDLDLPAPAGIEPPPPALADEGRNPFDDLDLPAPRSVLDEADEVFGELDLPMPKGAPESSGGFGELDLPLPKPRDASAPSFGELDLPAPRSDLPALAGGGLDSLEPHVAAELPVPTGLDKLDLPKPREWTAGPELGGDATDLPVAQGDADLPLAKAPDFGELELAQAPAVRDTAGRKGVGGTGFGELDLGDEPADDMEFADLPQRVSQPDIETELAPAAPPPQAPAEKGDGTKAPGKERATKSRVPLVVGGLLLLLVGGGAALGLTPHGYFGMYYVDRFLPGAGDPAVVRAAIREAEERAANDTWASNREALSILGRARRDAGLNRELLARSLLHESFFQLRFGADATRAARASAIRSRLAERRAESPETSLGLAADALRSGDSRRAAALLAEAARHAPDDPYVELLSGELALGGGELTEAREAFERAAQKGGGARALWGLARALRGQEGEHEAVEGVLSASPAHEEALLAKAARLFDEGDLDGANALAEQVAGRVPRDGELLRASPRARAVSFTLIGRIAEARGRSTQALEAYDRALAAHDAHIQALLGAGRVLLADRPADALARFDSVLSAGGEASRVALANGRSAAQEAQLGSARASLALERAQESARVLESLAAERSDDAEVLLWLGHAERRLDPPRLESAEAHYRAAISAAPEEFTGYLALAELFFETDRGSDAGAVLEQAAARVQESAAMRLELGRFELRRNRVPAAIRELRRSLALDPELPAAHFALGVAYRRSGRLEEAAQTFEHLARLDPAHPRLALERGLLFEARGESARAVEAYRAALRENEADLDLKLRLGAAQVAAGAIDDAERTLAEVYEARPGSPDAAHYVGRVAFARGRYGEALTQLREAVRIDPTRGEFHLYVGWAALENNLLGEALQSADAAIVRDPSLGEAYWVRGVVKLRSGNPAGALTDLTRALELRPSFHRVHPTMGDAYDQLGRLSDAIAAYERAVARVDDEGGWWWRLGRLRMDRGDRRGALAALSRAVLLGEAGTPLPGWLAAAHRLYGDALRLDGKRAEAVKHYRRYLALAPPGDIDRGEVRRLLVSMGETPGN